MCKHSLESGQRKYPITTAQVLIDKIFYQVDAQICIDWATAMLEYGYDGHYLVMLAGLTPQLNYFEIADYLNRALGEVGIGEVGIGEVSGAAAIAMYVADYLCPAVDNVTELEPELDSELESVLRSLRDLHVHLNYNSDLRDFYLLYYAYEGLHNDDVQYYWKGATQENIVSVIYQRAQDYLVQYALTQNDFVTDYLQSSFQLFP
ncbi:MAG: hypothetical protein AAFZ17_13285 [Cyanobacteria bacterium J06650_10]